MLAGLERLAGDAEVRLGDRQVDDDVDVGVGQERLDGLRLDAELLGPRLGRGHVEVGAGAHLQPLEERRQAEVGAGDVAAADDADAEGSAHDRLPQSCCAAAIERRAKRSASFGLSCSMTKYLALVRLAAPP